MRDIIIGDIHGCLNELIVLINKLNLKKNDTIYFIGDLIDRGEDSAGVIKYIYELSKKYKVVLILGNHDEKFLRYIKKNKKIINQEYEFILKKIEKKHIDFYEKSYYNYFIPEKNILLVHAGINDDIKLSLNENIPFNPNEKKSKYSILNLVRQIDEKGKMKFFDINVGIESKFWNTNYQGEYGKIIYGHTPIIQNKPVYFQNSICIDNGCVFGGWLSALLIDKNLKISFESIRFLK